MADGRDRMHTCVATITFREAVADVGIVRQAIIDSVANLNNFSLPLNTGGKRQSDDPSKLTINYHTPGLRYLDVLQLDMSPDHISVVSTSSNFCPDVAPFKWCRCCCGCFSFFGDNGQNEAHIRALAEALGVKISNEVEVVYSSRPK